MTAGQPRYAQHATFMRLDAAVGLPADAVVAGVPYDGGASFRPGARFGPRAVRDASTLLSGCSADGRGDLLRHLQIADAGDLRICPYSHAETMETVEAQVGSLILDGASPLLIGGDHSISLPLMRAVARRHGPLGLVHVDAHADTSRPTPEGHDHHGTPFRRAVEEGVIDPGKMVQVGIRGTCRDVEGLEWGRSRGITVVTMNAVAELGVQVVAEQIRAVVAAGPVHLSFDIDAVDPAYAPGTGFPVPGGLTALEALTLVRLLMPLPVVSADVVEVCPAYDVSGITALLAASLVYELLWLLTPPAADAKVRGAREVIDPPV